MDSLNKLLALINDANPHAPPLSLQQITFSIPIPDMGVTTQGLSWNTKVTVSSVPGYGYIGNVDVRYTRIEMGALGTNLGLLSEEPFTPETIVSMLNTQRNAFLSLYEIEDFSIPSMNVGDIETVVLAAKPDSFGWIGTTNLDLGFGLPSGTDELYQLMNFTLPASGYLN